MVLHLGHRAVFYHSLIQFRIVADVAILFHMPMIGGAGNGAVIFTNDDTEH
jgi:hypothetical protein